MCVKKVTKRFLLFLLLAVLIAGTALAAEAKTVRMDIAPLYQADYARVLFTFKGEDRSVASSGCSATCASMVIGYLNPEIEQDPEVIFVYAYLQKLYVGNGLSQKALISVLEAYGVACKWRNLAKTSLRESLEAGKPIIAYMGKGYFTDSGHYIVLTGIDKDGWVSVIDPNSPEKSEKTYSYKTILRQSRGSMPFIVCEKPEKTILQ